MIRKATAKRSEANAAVRRRAAGLDQRFKMSASVAGFPSINAATACLGFLFARVGARALRVLQLLQITPRCLPRRCESQDLYSALLLQRGSRSIGLFTRSLSR